ncbi:MAG: PEP-CTERM sorting domain-containing protein [Paraglaciecola sp.]|uniref:PEP-CTERM sorting domain-containing protein n=1 Tax=Paraglaciecola sp. TaxID=1920173 RepID=UPI0032973552
MKTKFRVVITGLFMLLVGNASATLIDFEDLAGDQSAVNDGYEGFTWNTGVGLLNSLNGTTYSTPSGYNVLADALDGDIVLFNGYGNSPVEVALVGAGTFELNSLWVTSAWDAALNMTFTGLLNGAEVYSQSFVATNTLAQQVTFDWSGIDMLRINDSGQHFVMDNMVINAGFEEVPEPASIAILALGLFGLASRRFKK